MSATGSRRNTRVKGHSLRNEGRVFRIGDRYYSSLYPTERNGEGLARCSCGAESPSLPTTAARRRWHATHKALIARGLAATEDQP